MIATSESKLIALNTSPEAVPTWVDRVVERAVIRADVDQLMGVALQRRIHDRPAPERTVEVNT